MVQTAGVTTARAAHRARTLADITAIGRAHLSTYGAAGLSLRAVARDLGVVSSAVYRYVPSRDDLLTLLVVDAYADLGEAARVAEAEVPRADHLGRWRAVTHAVRAWALTSPSSYGLLFGTPIPGYRAPAEQTTGPGTIVISLLLAIAADAQAAGAVPSSAGGGVPASVRRDAERVREQFGLALGDDMLTAALLAWVTLFGAVSFEVFGQYGPDTFSDPAAAFDVLVDLTAGVLGLTQPGPTPRGGSAS